MGEAGFTGIDQGTAPAVIRHSSFRLAFAGGKWLRLVRQLLHALHLGATVLLGLALSFVRRSA